MPFSDSGVSHHDRSRKYGRQKSSSDESHPYKGSTSGGSGSTRRSEVEAYSSSRHRSSSRRRSRSRSVSASPVRRNYSRDYQRGRQGRDRPQASRCIGVFGLNTNTTQHRVRELFNKFGPIERIQMVIDAHTHRSRGFCFIYFENLHDARVAKESCSGIEVDDRRIRVDYSITQRAHTPTPGVYMGRLSRYGRERHGNSEGSPRSRRRDRDSSASPVSYSKSSRRYSRDREYYRQKGSTSSRHRYGRSRSKLSRSRTPRKSARESRY